MAGAGYGVVKRRVEYILAWVGCGCLEQMFGCWDFSFSVCFTTEGREFFEGTEGNDLDHKGTKGTKED